MKTVINVNGGLGREICFTGIIDKYHELNPEEEIIVIAGFTDIFMNKPYIKRVYHHHAEYLYDDVISKADKYFEIEPYNRVEYFKHNKHLINVSNLILNGKDEFVKPNIELNDVEKKLAQDFMNNFKKENPNKKLCLLQAFGSSGAYKKGDLTNRSLTDDEAIKIRNLLKEKGYEIYMIGHDESKGLPETKMFKGLSIRQIISLIPFVDLVVSVDSFIPHLCSCLNKECIVLWKTTLEQNLGYETNINIKPVGDVRIIPNRLHLIIPNPEMVNANIKIDIDKFIEVLK
jgi:hypothetical protein